VQDINIYHLVKFYAKKWPVIAISAAAGLIVGLAYNAYIQVPLYKSDATLLLIGTDATKSTQDSTLINNYIQLLKSRRVLEPVIKDNNDGLTYENLVAATTATNEKNTEVIRISIASTNPQTSKLLVDGTVLSFRNEIKELYNKDNISVVDNANTPSEPYNVHKIVQLGLTTIGSILLSIIGLFFTYDLKLAKKDTVKSKVTPKPKTPPASASKPKVVTVKSKRKAATGRRAVKKVVDLIIGGEEANGATPAKQTGNKKSTKPSKSKH
jgi:protein tyrosine kinase modulator